MLQVAARSAGVSRAYNEMTQKENELVHNVQELDTELLLDLDLGLVQWAW